jgi:hypothetical protein
MAGPGFFARQQESRTANVRLERISQNWSGRERRRGPMAGSCRVTRLVLVEPNLA